MEAVGENVGLRYKSETNYRDVFLQGSCDDQITEVCRELGWTKELEAAVAAQSLSLDGWKKVVDAQREIVSRDCT